MTIFLVERYVPSMTGEELAKAVARLALLEAGVRHLWTTVLVDEETCLSLFEAPDREAVERANTLARFPFDRIVEASLLSTAGGKADA